MPTRNLTTRAGGRLVSAISALILVACGVVGGPGGPGSGPETRAVQRTAEARNAGLILRIEEAEALWNDQAISSYFIEVAHIQSIWHAQWQQVIVRDGVIQAAEGSCIPSPFEQRDCEVEPFDPQTYTVPGLFERAYAAARSDQAEWVEITFDPTYGFPSGIDFDDPMVADDDWAITVETFTPLR